MNINLGTEGHFTVQRMRDGEVIEELKFKNLILDRGMEMFMGEDDVVPWLYARVGTDNSAEAVTQSTLGNQVSSQIRDAVGDFAINTTDHYIYYRHTYTWAIGSVVGNMSEVGVGKGETGTTLFSRSRIRDTNGDPTTISILADEQLRVIYEFRLYQPMTDIFTGTVGSYGVIFRAAKVNDSTKWTYQGFGSLDKHSFHKLGSSYLVFPSDIGSVTGEPTGYSEDANITASDYTATYLGSGTVEIEVTIKASAGNPAGGMRTFVFYQGPGYWQMQFDPAIPKNNTNRVKLKFRFTMTRR